MFMIVCFLSVTICTNYRLLTIDQWVLYLWVQHGSIMVCHRQQKSPCDKYELKHLEALHC